MSIISDWLNWSEIMILTVIYYNYVLLPESQIDNKDHGVCK